MTSAKNTAKLLAKRAPRILVTAGPTHEPIDRVRYLANRSSGRMGIAIALEAARRGCDVTLLLGPIPGPPPEHLARSTHRFTTTADLSALLDAHFPAAGLTIMVAAVADYRPVQHVPVDREDATAPAQKVPRRKEGMTLELEATPDLVAGLATRARPDQRIIGFALEPEASLTARAAAKLAHKGLDAIVANPLETMDATTITGRLLRKSGAESVAPRDLAKEAFAAWLLDELGVGGTGE